MADGKKDNKYQEYLLHLQGWKVRKDSRVDPSDKSLDKSLWTVTKDEVEKYDTSPVRIALFGLGRIGMIHLQKIYSNPRTKLVYCVEPVAERRQYVRTAWFLNDVTFLDISDVDKVLEDPEIDAIVIGTPTYTHKELTIKSLKAKKAVLCEKPLAPDFDGTKECYELAEKMGVPLLTAFNRRFDPGFFDCRTRARAGEVGKIRVIKTCARDSPLPPIEYLKTSGGIYKDCACHDIDIILWVTGELPYQVFSQAHVYDDKIKEIDDFDTVGIMMKFPSGTLGIIDLSRNSSYGYDQRLEVFGLDGMLTGGNIRPNGVVTENNKGTNQTPYFYSFASRFGEAYGQELEHFVDVMKGKEKIQITKMDSLKGFTVVLAAEKSARSGKSVYINWSDDGSGTLVDENEYKKSKSGSKSESKSKSDSKSESKTDAKSESKTDTKSESKTSAKSDSKTSGKSDSETSAKSDSKSKSVTKTDSKSESKADAKSESKSKSETKADSKSESKTESKSKSK